jgi:hypothetical protein
VRPTPADTGHSGSCFAGAPAGLGGLPSAARPPGARLSEISPFDATCALEASIGWAAQHRLAAAITPGLTSLAKVGA